ncbi:MAG: hypothetical protein K8F91_04245 [Candidatus Obscuribacterales bacterium]|nr:hypothetical protein [Candidatus Obscuribacterales bacterium]
MSEKNTTTPKETAKLSAELVLPILGIAVVVIIFLVNIAIVFYVTDRMMRMEDENKKIYLEHLNQPESVPLPDLMKDAVDNTESGAEEKNTR